MIKKNLIAALISSLIGAVFWLALFYILGFSEDKTDLGFILLFGPLKQTMSYMLIPFILATGYAGFNIPKYIREEDNETFKIARAHALTANTLTWLGWIVVYYSSGFGAFGHLYGIGVPILGFSIGLLLFPLTISYLAVFLVQQLKD